MTAKDPSSPRDLQQETTLHPRMTEAEVASADLTPGRLTGEAHLATAAVMTGTPTPALLA